MRRAPSRSRSRRSRGVSLLTTLIILGALSMIVISYLAMIRHEAAVSDHLADRLRADLAARAAYEMASERLRTLTASDDYLVSVVTRMDAESGAPARHTFISQPGHERLTHHPLFAGGQTRTVAMPRLDAASGAMLTGASPEAPEIAFDPDLSAVARVIETFPLTHLIEGAPISESTRPETRFIEPDADTGAPRKIRHTYWIEDLQGLPQVDVIGSWTDHFDAGDSPFLSANQIRAGYGPHDARTNPASGDDAGLWLGIPGSLPGHGHQFPKAFRGQSLIGQMAPGLSAREIFPHPWTTPRLAARDHPYAEAHALLAGRHWMIGGGGGPRNFSPEIERRFASGLRAYEERPLIPWGHDYPDAGQPRHAINRLLRERDIDGIAAIVNRNLPAFKDRAGGFPEDYLRTLAANLIDYADEDSLPTYRQDSHRGVDSYPTVNEFYIRFQYDLEKRGDTFLYRFTATPYLEFWNSTSRESRLENFRLRFEFTNSFGFSGPDGAMIDLRDTEPVKNDAFDTPTSLVLAPNAFAVVRLGDIVWEVGVEAPGILDAPLTAVYDFEEGGPSNDSEAHFEILIDDPGAPGTPQPVMRESRKSFRFIAFYGNYVNDQSARTPFPAGAYFWRALPISLFTAGGSHSNYGDPWMAHYTAAQQAELYYVNDASPGGRNLRHSKAANGLSFKDRQRVHDWPDRGYSAPAPFAPPGRHSVDPETAAATSAPPTEPAMAPFRLGDSGRYWSVTELGHLHDHHMWIPKLGSDYNGAGEQTYDNSPELLVWDLPADAVADGRWGGGSTLRVGRKEFTKFDQPGMRASQWLDLFHAGVNGTNLTLGGSGPDAYQHYDPRDHQPPPTARTAAEATQRPYTDLYPETHHAESPLRAVRGQLNLNSAPTAFEIEMLLRGPFSSTGVMPAPGGENAPDGPAFAQETSPARAATHGLDPDACGRIAARLLAARPFHSPSHLARVLSRLIHEEAALPPYHSDAEAEETFARMHNLTTLSSRHFRIHTHGEVYTDQAGADAPVVLGRATRVYEVFLRPHRNPATLEIEKVTCEILSVTEP